MTDTHFLLRPATMADLPAIERFAQLGTFGIHTLKPGREHLIERIERSQRCFASDDEPSADDLYHFVLEDLARGGIVGTSGIVASAGAGGRFFSYRNEFTVHASEELGITNRVHTLRLCEDLSGHSLLSSFFIDPAYAQTLAPQLLSRGRLMFIRQFAERFAERIGAENPGLCDDEGHSPVWEALGRRFFQMDFPQAERLTHGRSKAYIAELMPRSPIYVPLLAETAQWALGQLHPDAELPFSILLDEGFDADSYVDIFDGGPIVEARASMLKTVAAAHVTELIEAATPEGDVHLIANGLRHDYRVTLAAAKPDASGRPGVEGEVLRRLCVDGRQAVLAVRADWC